jgi:dTDP-4-dehydrorhamnose reductase
VAIAAREVGAKLVYISTDYVFDGAKEEPYLEFDPPYPINVYGMSKLLGEILVKEQTNQFFIIRTAWLYGKTGSNFVKTMLRLAREREELRVVNDQRGTPTCGRDLSRQIAELTQTESYGTYHCTSQGSCTWFEFALAIFKYAGYEAKVDPSGSVRLTPNPQALTPSTQDLKPIIVSPVTSEEFPRPARRPKNSVLENFMLKLQGLDIMPLWEESLAKFLRNVGRRYQVPDRRSQVGSIESEVGATFMIHESCAAKVSLIPKDNGNILWLLTIGHKPPTTDYHL